MGGLGGLASLQVVTVLLLLSVPCLSMDNDGSTTTYNYLKAVNPTLPFQPVVSSLGCASAQFVDQRSTFFVLQGACFAGPQSHATWLYSVGPNTWFRHEPVFSSAAGPENRDGHSIGTLPDESGVMLFGGLRANNFSAPPLSDTWLFAAETLQWMIIQPVGGVTPAGRYASSLVGCRESHGCAENGGVFLYGGLRHPAADGGPPIMLSDLWRADVDKQAKTVHWQEITPTADPAHGSPGPRGGPFTAIGNSTLYLSGGVVYNVTGVVYPLLDLWKLDLHTYAWSRLKDINVPTSSEDICVVTGLNFVPLESGVTPTLIALLSCSAASEMRVWSYTIDHDHWESVWYIKGDSLPPPFVQPIAQEHNEQVYIYGGIDSQSRVFTGLWVLRYNPDESTCVQAAAPDILPPIVSQHAATFLKETQAMYVYGGVYPSSPALPGMQLRLLNLADTRLHMFNTSESMWTSIVRTGIPQLAGHTMVSWGHSLVVFGGFNTTGFSQSSMYKFDLITLVWSEVVSPSYTYMPRHSHAATLDKANGLMYVYGGLFSDSPQHIEVLGDLLVYNISANTWHELPIVGTRPPAVFGHSMVLIGNDLYVLGGATAATHGNYIAVNAVQDMIWRYSLVNHTWENLCYLVTPELYHPLLEGRFFTTAAAKDLALMMFVGDCCNNSCIINTKDLRPGIAFNSHDVARMCCSNASSAAASHARVWLLATREGTWMEVKMSYSPSASKSPIRHAGHSLTNVEDKFLVHGGLCGSENDNTLCSLALPTYSIQPGCNPGWYSAQVFDTACQQCPATNYSTGPGSIECEGCPMGSFAAHNGSTNRLQCRFCPRDLCYDAGDCSIDPGTGTVQCDCDFGYDGDSRCRVPSVFLGIGGAGVAIIILLLITCLLVRKYKDKQRQDQEKDRQLRTYKQEVSNLSSVWRIEAEELKLTERIDGDTPGSFGEVWLAVYRDMQVAVKKLQTQVLVADTHALVEFQREAEFMRTIRHPNIVLFLGAGVMEPTDVKESRVPFLVVEYMSRGTLRSVLRDKTCHIDHQQRLRMALDVAKGMRFLHGLTPPRIHRDLKSANLLVSEHFVVKVADFGSARWIHSLEECQQVSSLSRSTSSTASTPINSRVLAGDIEENPDTNDPRTPLLSRFKPDALMSSDVGTILWSAPEVLAQEAYGAAADVFSFSIVLWELYSRQEPYANTGLRFSFEFVKHIVDGGRPDVDEDCPSDYKDLIEQCWQVIAERRPKFTEIVPSLDNQLERCFSKP